MRFRVWLLALASLVLASCASVGDPLPPALYIPERVADFSVVQRGPALVVRFTAPALTTEALGLGELAGAELRVGPIPAEFSYEAWAAGAEAVRLETPEPGASVSLEIPAQRWAGREILAAVRFAGPRGRQSEWSNSVVLTPRAPLDRPAAKAQPHPEGIRVTWTPVEGATTYRVLREGAEPAVVSANEYIDRAVETGKSYSYRVTAVATNVESLPSEAATTMAEDLFPPAPPSGLTVVAGLKSIELAWNRATEADFSNYRVYRAEGDGEFALLADAVEGPAWSDRQTESGKTYRYRVTAVDRTGNESAPSNVVQATAP